SPPSSSNASGVCPGVWMINTTTVAPGTIAIRILTGTGAVSVSAASVANNIATLTMSSNPITKGFIVGMPIAVSGFSGGDTYFNGTFTVLNVTSTQVLYALGHANAGATSQGSVTGVPIVAPVKGVTALQAIISGTVHTILGVGAIPQPLLIDLTGG